MTTIVSLITRNTTTTTTAPTTIINTIFTPDELPQGQSAFEGFGVGALGQDADINNVDWSIGGCCFWFGGLDCAGFLEQVNPDTPNDATWYNYTQFAQVALGLLSDGSDLCGTGLIDFTNERVRFMYSLAAGGGALVLRRGMDRNLVGGSALISDGDFADDVHVHAGGTTAPVTAAHLGTGAMLLDVTDPVGMKSRLAERSHRNFMAVIEGARDASDFARIDWLGLLHMKRSAHRAVLGEVGLTEADAVYLEDLGHLGQLDPIFCLERGRAAGKLTDGTRIVLASAGVSYAWGAIGVSWGRCPTPTPGSPS